MLIRSECLAAMREMPDACMDSIVTDPPYELSNDGQHSPQRVFAKLVFPENPNLVSETPGENNLGLLVDKVLGLGVRGIIPEPSASVPVGSVALNDDSAQRQHDVVNSQVGAIGIASDATGVDREAKTPEHLGDFFLELTDFAKTSQVLSEIGTGFDSSGLGVGFRIGSTGFPRFQGAGSPVVSCGDDVRSCDDALSDLASAFRGTSGLPVFGFQLGRAAIEEFSADGARLFSAILLSTGAKLIRASTRTSSLPAVLKSRTISVVDDHANRAFTFNLIFHPQSVSSKGFMGKDWDGSKIAYSVEMWAEALRILKPGGHLLAFGATRTYHRMACAIEDAGFEIRDSIHWIYGSGFPKSLNVGKAIDKSQGNKRTEQIGTSRGVVVDDNQGYGGIARGGVGIVQKGGDIPIMAPASAEAALWEGWGTALKPAHEPIVVARKPLIGTVAANILEYGTGALNIDATRVGYQDDEVDFDKVQRQQNSDGAIEGAFGAASLIGTEIPTYKPEGRWPANIVLTHSPECRQTGVPVYECAENCPVAVMDEQSGERKAGGKVRGSELSRTGDNGIYGEWGRVENEPFKDTGGASRYFYQAEPDELDGPPFFYTAKANKKERNSGVEDANTHPTVKPVALMRYLVRLVTPPGGRVFDPFLGSGTTAVAAILEGMEWFGTEMTEEYYPIIKGRVAWAEEQMSSK